MKRREFLKAAGVGRCWLGGRRTGDCPVDAGDQMAAGGELAEVARYAVWRLRIFRQAHRRDHRQQIPDPGRSPPARSCPACRCSTPCRTAPSRWATPRCYYYWGKDPAFTFGTALPFGLNSRQMNSWLRFGGGEELLNDLLKSYNCIGFAAANTGAQMGGWFRKEIKSLDDLKGLKMRDRRLCRHDHVQGRRRAAAAGRRRHLSGAGEGHDRRRRMGRPV